mmetsp:Transcript_2217/g.2936  ORF Transcript_2217/g.2936 Transcript_2217/m.2936 type:complete len:265 (-) Transcript_2217:52-846(-)
MSDNNDEEVVDLTMMANIQKACQTLSEAQNVVVFTGAGISVESGIPDFRSKGGLWEKFDPNIYANYQNFLQEPKKFWEMAQEMNKIVMGAKPNPAHIALAELEAMGKVTAVITQNIDNLHQQAGSKKVFELHGGSDTASCIGCKEKYTAEFIKEQLQSGVEVPRCSKCKQLVKTDVILFGEGLPRDVIEGAMEAAQNCDALIVIGSSLTVSPANMLPPMARMSGAKLIFINKDPTALDTYADIIIHGEAGKVLPEILKGLKAKH